MIESAIVHGGNGGYQAGCREQCCRSAHAANQRRLRAGPRRRLEAGPVLAAVGYAMAAGVSWAEIRRKVCPHRSISDMRAVKSVYRSTAVGLLDAIDVELQARADRLADARSALQFARRRLDG